MEFLYDALTHVRSVEDTHTRTHAHLIPAVLWCSHVDSITNGPIRHTVLLPGAFTPSQLVRYVVKGCKYSAQTWADVLGPNEFIFVLSVTESAVSH